MTEPVLLLFASHHGHTRKFIRFMCEALGKHQVPVLPFDLLHETPEPHIIQDATLVFAVAPIRYGFHLAAVTRFLCKYKQELSKKPLVLTSINLTARKPKKNTPLTNSYFKKWVKQNSFDPILGAVFGGELDYKKYPFWDRWAIRLIMTITGGYTNFDTAIDYTDWDHAIMFAGDIATLYHNIDKVENVA